jgi:hypothetical protein
MNKLLLFDFRRNFCGKPIFMKPKLNQTFFKIISLLLLNIKSKSNIVFLD